MTSRYDLENLRRHTTDIRFAAEKITAAHGTILQDGYCAFNDFVEQLERSPASLVRNVRLLLACRFFNHVHSALLLSEAGLTVDALICERTAIECLAAFRLVSVAPSYAEKYEMDGFPRPAETRRLLELHGSPEDAKHSRALYSSGSQMVHVTRSNERFNAAWESAGSARLLFGGRYMEADHQEMLRFLGAAIFWFIGGIGDADGSARVAG